MSRSSGRAPRGSRSARSASPAGRRRPTYHHGDLRAALLDTIGGIIRDRGVAFVSVREVARRARVSHAAPAHHFGNKSGLLTAFAVQGYDRLTETVRRELEARGAVGPARVLQVMGEAYVRFALENREHFAIMFPGELLDTADPEYVRASNRAFAPFADTVAAAARAGAFSAEPMLVAAAAWSLVHGVASLWLSGRLQARTGATDPQALAEAVTRLFVEATLRGR